MNKTQSLFCIVLDWRIIAYFQVPVIMMDNKWNLAYMFSMPEPTEMLKMRYHLTSKLVMSTTGQIIKNIIWTWICPKLVKIKIIYIKYSVGFHFSECTENKLPSEVSSFSNFVHLVLSTCCVEFYIYKNSQL